MGPVGEAEAEDTVVAESVAVPDTELDDTEEPLKAYADTRNTISMVSRVRTREDFYVD